MCSDATSCHRNHALEENLLEVCLRIFAIEYDQIFAAKFEAIVRLVTRLHKICKMLKIVHLRAVETLKNLVLDICVTDCDFACKDLCEHNKLLVRSSFVGSIVIQLQELHWQCLRLFLIEVFPKG